MPIQPWNRLSRCSQCSLEIHAVVKHKAFVDRASPSWLTVGNWSACRNWNCLKILKDCGYWDYRPHSWRGFRYSWVFALSRSGQITSGDNPVTVSCIAQQAGFKIMNYVDCSKISDDQLVDQAEETAIFGRVSPHQKNYLSKPWKRWSDNCYDRRWGQMISPLSSRNELLHRDGWGILSARQIANIVLLNSDFSIDVPEILLKAVVWWIACRSNLLCQLFLPLNIICVRGI